MKFARENLRLPFLIQYVIFAVLYFPYLSAGSLGGSPNYFAYQPYNNVFRDQQYARGFVRIDNGFTVAVPASGVGSTHGACVFMDTCISVSGAIDLRGTNTIFLQSDLNLDNGATFSYSGGNIYGYDRALILNGDLTIPAGTILHFGDRIAVNGNGHRLILGSGAQLFVDAKATLTLRDLILQNTINNPGNPAVQCAAGGSAAYSSKLCLDNVELILANDFYFNQGQIFIHNDVAVTGTSAFFYRSCQPSFITSGAKLFFDIGTTFDFYPSTTGTPQLLAKDLLFMQDATSQLYLNGCTLKSTYTGFRLTTGELLLDNKVSMTSAAAFRLSDFSTTVTNWQATIRAACVDWHPSGKYVAFGVDNGIASSIRFVVLGFNGTSFTQIAQTATWSNYALGVNWSPDGKYLACAGQNASTVIVYSFNGTALTQVASISTGTSAWTARWSPDGRYLVVASNWTSNQLAIYAFTGNSLVFVVSANLGGGSSGASWSPDGKAIAVCYNAATLAIYQFTGASLSLLNSYSIASANDVAWSPDGRFLATAAVTRPMGWVHYFTGSALVRIASYAGSSGATSYACAWDKTGRYVAFGGQDQSTPTYNAVACQLVGNTLSPIGTFYFSTTYARGIAFSPDNNFLAIAANVANAGFQELEIQALHWSYETQTQALSNSIVFGNSILGSNYDLNVRGLSGAQMSVDGLINYDCVS